MKTRILAVLLLAALGMAGGAVAGGRIVAVDDRGQVGRIDAGLNRTLHVVDSLGPRGSVYLYELDDGTHTLVVWSHQENHLHRTVQPISDADLARLRATISEQQREADDPVARLDRSGRGHLLRGMALLSAGYYGWAYPELLAREDAEYRSYSGGGLGGVAMMTTFGVLLPAFATEFMPIPDGTARLGIWGGTRGILAGSLIYRSWVWDPEDQPEYGQWSCFGTTHESKNERNELRTPLLTSLGMLAGGLAVGYATHIGAGDAALIGVCGDAGFLGGGLGDMARENHTRLPRNDVSFSRSALLGGASGMAAGAVLSRLQSYSVGDAIIVRGTAALGTLLPASVAIAADLDGRTGAPLCIGGLAAGVALGHYLTRDWDYTPTDGGMLTFAALAGGSASFALACILRPMFDPGQDIGKLGLPAFTLGASATGVLAWRALNYHRLGLERTQTWRFDVTPQLAQSPDGLMPMLGLRVER